MTGLKPYFEKYFPVLVAVSLLPFLFPLFFYADDGISSIASSAGFLAGGALLWQHVLGMRQVTSLFSKDHGSYVRWHIFFGVYGMLLLLVHPLLEMTIFKKTVSFLFLWDFSSSWAMFVTFGRIALLGFIILGISSIILRKRISYRLWKYIHYISYPATFFVFIHAYSIGTYLEGYFLLKLYWGFCTLVYVLIVLYRLLAPVFEPKYEIQSKVDVASGITFYILVPKGNRRILPKSGQYVYLRTSLWGEAHPFSVMRYDEHWQSIELGIKGFGPFTKQLATYSVGTPVYLSGPYGTFMQEPHELRVCIAGGIGITPFVQYVENHAEHTYLVSCMRTKETSVLREHFMDVLGTHFIELCSHEESCPEVLSKDTLMKYLPAEQFTRAHFYICGPKGLMDLAKKILSELGVEKNRIHTEEFSF